MKRSKYGKGYIVGSQPRSKKNLLYSLSYSLMHMVPVDKDPGFDNLLYVIMEIIQKAHHTKKRKIAQTIRTINCALMTETLCDVYGNPAPLYMYQPEEVKNECRKYFNRAQIAELCQDKNFTIFQEKYWAALRVLMVAVKNKLAEAKEEKVVQ